MNEDNNVEMYNEGSNISTAISTVFAIPCIQEASVQEAPEIIIDEVYEDEDASLDMLEIEEYEPTEEEVAESIREYTAKHPPTTQDEPDKKTAARELMLSLLSGKGGLRLAIAEMQKHEVTKIKTQKHKAKQYRYCDIVQHCRHCGHEGEHRVTLETKADTFSYIGEDKHVNIVTYETVEQPHKFLSYVSYCDKCCTYIKEMSREELEKKYIKLLRRNV